MPEARQDVHGDQPIEAELPQEKARCERAPDVQAVQNPLPIQHDQHRIENRQLDQYRNEEDRGQDASREDRQVLVVLLRRGAVHGADSSADNLCLEPKWLEPRCYSPITCLHERK